MIPNALMIAMFGWINEPKALYIPAPAVPSEYF